MYEYKHLIWPLLRVFFSVAFIVPCGAFAQVPNPPFETQDRSNFRPSKVSLEVESRFLSLDALDLSDPLLQRVRKEVSGRNREESVAQSVGEPPHPILFVHGLDSRAETWQPAFETLSAIWGDWQQFDVNLNADETTICTIPVDVFVKTDSLSDGNLFAVDFQQFPEGSTDLSESNESAIIKQGAALEEAIQSVKSATGEEEVILAGHSMGGLAIREYLQRRNSSDEPRWWVEPDQVDGHSVAQVVTYGTPHWGTNFNWIDIFGPSQEGPTEQEALQVPDPASEAVRDLRLSYANDPPSGDQGRYLYGGVEGWSEGLYGWHNTDVNCDGDEGDLITGINETSSAGFEYPLPTDLPYTWITSSCSDGESGYVDCSDVNPGDGVVSLGSQYISTEDGDPYPVGRADTLFRSVPHTAEPQDLHGLLRGLDEPGLLQTAYTIETNKPSGRSTDGYLTAQPGYRADPLADRDAYQFEVSQPGSVTLQLPSVPSDSSWSIYLTENGLITAFSFGEQPTSQPVRITTSVAEGYGHTALVNSRVGGYDERFLYSFRADTRQLEHFSYTPRHGGFGDTTEQGFAGVFIPKEVPEIVGGTLDGGDEFGIFTPDGTCVGAAVWDSAPTFVTAFGNENGGLSEGDSLHVRVWDKDTDTEYFVDGELSGNNGVYEPGEYYLAEQLQAGTPVPVELADFSARADGSSTAILQWKTASETGNAGFEIQHRASGKEPWSELGFVESKAQGGTTTETKSYSYTAEDLPVGTHRFRLKQVDLDGSSTLTGPVSVDIQMQEALRLTAPAPNPTSTSANLSFAVKEQSETTITLYNTLGQQVATVYVGTPQAGEEQTAQVDVSGLSSGTYFLRLQASGKTATRQMTVVR